MPLSIVYVLTNPAMPDLVKIGMTDGGDPQSRLAQLYGTGVPFPFKLEFACRVPNPEEVERALHTAFGPQRVNPRREFFKIDPAQAIAILKLLHVEDATRELTANTSEATKQEEAAGETFEKSRRPNLNFQEMGIPVGAVLGSKVGEREATVSGPRRVALDGQEVSLTEATRLVLGNDYNVAPTPYWTFNGRSLKVIYEETYPTLGEE